MRQQASYWICAGMMPFVSGNIPPSKMLANLENITDKNSVKDYNHEIVGILSGYDIIKKISVN